MIKRSTIEVFKTNIAGEKEAIVLLGKMRKQFPEYRISVDLEDIDRILKAESPGELSYHRLINFVEMEGFNIQILPD